MSIRGKRKDITPSSYTSKLIPNELDDCFRRKMNELKIEFESYISEADNGMIFFKDTVTGFVYGDDQILYAPDSNIEQNAMPGQGNQVNITNNTVTLLIEQNIPFKVIMIPRIISNQPVLQRELSFDLKNKLTPVQNGKFCALFLLDIYLNPNYNLTPEQKAKIKEILINIDICNTDPNSIDWSQYIFLLMPGVYTNFVEDKSLQMIPKGGSRSKTRKPNKGRKTNKRRKTNKKGKTNKRRKS